jgi:hypothetical protein
MPFRRLPSRAQLWSLITIVVFVAGTLLYVGTPSSGVREFERAEQALHHVTSWKMKSNLAGTDGATGDYLDEVDCPSAERTTQHIHWTAANARDIMLQTIFVGNDRYMYNDWAKSWSHEVISGGPVTCAVLASGEDAGGLPPLRKWATAAYIIDKENLRETSDGPCREWKVHIPGGFSAQPTSEFVCLGVKDHLPRFRGYPGTPSEVRFYDWNVPMDITAPIPDGGPAPVEK